MSILIPILVLCSLGLCFGVGLAIASKRLAVKTDPRLDRILGLLPGSNCGACGQAGCFGLAEKILSGEAKIDACRVAQYEVKEAIAAILGRKLDTAAKKTAVPHCNGGKKVKDRFLYKGIEDCTAANLILAGQKECVWGCLGFGACVKVCPFGAIAMSSEALPVVDKNKCKACNKCVVACPKKLFSLIPATHSVYVACSSCDSGKDTRAVCPVGCIACKKCVQACPVDAIAVIDNLAVIDYNKCTSCGKCVQACPMKTIGLPAGRQE